MEDSELDQLLRQEMPPISRSKRRPRYIRLSTAYGQEKRGGTKLPRGLAYQRMGGQWYMLLFIDGLEVGKFVFRRTLKYWGDIIPDTVSATVHTYVLLPEEFYKEVFSIEDVKSRYKKRFDRDKEQLGQVVDRLLQVGPVGSTRGTFLMCQIRKKEYS